MKTIDLTDYKLKEGDEEAIATDDTLDRVEELQEFEEGQVVEHREEGPGVIAATITSDTSWYTDPNDDDTEVVIEASEEEPVYVVGLLEGGSVPAEPSDLEEGPDELPGEGEEPDPMEEQPEAELAPVYEYMDDPNSMAELESAKVKLIRERHSELLADHMESEELSLNDLAELSYEELLNIPGVDDPEVGFASDPEGWTRKSYLQAWATVGATWRSCYARMIRHFGSRMAKRWCAALKDEILGTERWRNRF